MAASPEAFEIPSLHRAWDQVVKNFGAILALWVILFCLFVVSYVLYYFFYLSSIALWGLALGRSSAPVTVASFSAQLMAPVSFHVLNCARDSIGVIAAVIPAIYFATGEVVKVADIFGLLRRQFWRYFGAGLLFSLCVFLGSLACVIPGLAVAFVYPVYVNKVFTTDEPILDAFSSSFDALYGNPDKWSFVALELLAWLVVGFVSNCTCGFGWLIAAPVAAFFIQNAAYRWGVIS